ncbi:MAG: hypothetical protein JSV53_00550 [candidate division WOR-3 bacterium]|nr:MAG: hypothetical protein JSV53_00550 [candidate division WOR-3 bacterium]
MPKKKIKIRIKRGIKQRSPHKPTRVHRDKTKYTRKGRRANRRRKELIGELKKNKEQ